AHESFENEAIAKIMNDNFVNVKVDRWKEQSDKLKKAGAEAIEMLQKFTSDEGRGGSSELNLKISQKLYQFFVDSFDDDEGGFDGKSEPKFPTPVQFHFLLRHYYYTLVDLGKAEERFAIMSISEIRDRGTKLGIDFKDCTNDAEFLKKLQDVVTNRRQAAERELEMVKFTLKAQLLMSYVETYVISGDHYYADVRSALYGDVNAMFPLQVARDIIKYVERDLKDPEGGGFFSAEDADSYPYEGAEHKLEGAFCVWEEPEIKEILGDRNSEIFCGHFGVKSNGNVDPRKDIQGELKNKNVLIERHALEETANHFNLSLSELNEILSESKEKLLRFRFEKRPRPHRDDKILTAWNGLMISGLARAYDALRDEKIRDLAEGAAKFLKERMYNKERKVLLRSFREGPSDVEGFADDYSYLIGGLLDLYQSTFNESYLEWAIDLQDTQDRLFYDEKNGGYFNVKENARDILVRLKDDHDGAEPSANLIRLGHIVDGSDYNRKAEQSLKFFAGKLSRAPFSMPAMVSGLMLHQKGVKQLIITGRKQESNVQQFLNIIQSKFIPSKVLLRVSPEESLVIKERNESVKSILESESGGLTSSVHICENFTCGKPIREVGELEDRLKE
ncbi:3856_t:CDS:10, partial [Acaulospora colombiana]